MKAARSKTKGPLKAEKGVKRERDEEYEKIIKSAWEKKPKAATSPTTEEIIDLSGDD